MAEYASLDIIPHQGVIMMRTDPRNFAHEARLLERRSRIYVLITGVMILFAAFGFIWLTW
jgi:hypothetical protein